VTEDWAKYLDQYSVADGRKQLEDLRAAAEDIMIALARYRPAVGSSDAVRCAGLINLLVYLQRQLSRLICSGEESCDLLAWVARNILETRLWAEYLLKDSATSNASSTDSFSALAESIRERHEQLGHSSKRVRLSLNPCDSLVYKHLSKHVHATAWLINQQLDLVTSEPNRKLFHICAEWDATVIVSVALDEAKRIRDRTELASRAPVPVATARIKP
jgi:hypothetical protein